MSSEWINPVFFEKQTLSKLQTEYFNAKPFKYLIIPQFLDSSLFKELNFEISKLEFTPKSSDLFEFKQTKDFKQLTSNTLIKQFHDTFKSKKILSLFSTITNEQYSDIDMHAMKFEYTNYLLCHDDLVEGRKTAFVLYLNEDWKKEDGGTLDLFDAKPEKIVTSIVPIQNTLILFQVSKESFHQVSEILSKKNRKTIGGWLL